MAFAAAAKLDGRVVRGRAPDIPAAYWVQWLAGTALIPLVFALAATLGGPWRGPGRGAARGRDLPAADRGHRRLLSEPLGALWLTAAMLALARRRYALAGLLLAAAVLTRANLLVLIPVLALSLGTAARRGVRRRGARARRGCGR